MNMNTRFVVAPMVNQSDLPFRLLTRKHGATMAYTQMLLPEKLLNEQEYLEYHIRDLTVASADPLNAPVVVQLCGNDPEIIVQAGKKLQNYCTAIGAACPSSPNCHHNNNLPYCRPQPRMPAGSCKRWPLRSLSLASEGLAPSRGDRYQGLVLLIRR